MIHELAEVADEVRPAVRPGTALAIAIVGAGAIVDLAHLPAYHAAGLDVIGITDLDRGRATDVARRHGIARVYDDVDAMLTDHSASVVDIAVPGPAQPAILEQALRSGYHVLAQKPFAPDAATGRRLAELADDLGLCVVVNQQLRYDEGVAAARVMIRRRWVGQVHRVEFRVRIHTDWSAWPWLLGTPRLEISNHSIHYHDAVRWFLGEPETVFCVGARVPGQAAVGETSTTSTYTFASGAHAVVSADHNAIRTEPTATFQVDGTEGMIRGTLGLLYDYPHGRHDTLEVNSDVLGTDGWLAYPVSRRWLPDAFIGPMASLLDHIAGGPEPITTAHDNVRTLALVDALYRSQATGETQRPSQ